MTRTVHILCLAASLLGALLGTGCMTFETTLPGTLDLRAAMAQPQDAPLEPKRPAFGDMGDSYFEGFVMTESTDKPTKGEYAVPKEPMAGQFVTPPAPAGSKVYRRLLRQWFIIGLFPILANPENVTSDLKTELAKPGAKATNVRITSGADLIDFGRSVVAGLLTYFIVGGIIAAVPTRTTEVIAYITSAPDTAAPAPVAAPVPPETPLPPTSPSPPDKPVTK